MDKIKKVHLRRQGYKWYWLLLITALTGLLLYTWLIPAINYLFLSSKVNTELSKEINKFIPGDKIEDIVDNVDLIIPTWELNNREPYLFSKTSMRDEPDKYGKYNNLQTMTFLSAVNPLYILPYQDGDKVFISGNNFAKGPSMQAFLNALEDPQNPRNPEDVVVVSVGSLEERPDRISKTIGALEWALRIASL